MQISWTFSVFDLHENQALIQVQKMKIDMMLWYQNRQERQNTNNRTRTLKKWDSRLTPFSLTQKRRIKLLCVLYCLRRTRGRQPCMKSPRSHGKRKNEEPHKAFSFSLTHSSKRAFIVCCWPFVAFEIAHARTQQWGYLRPKRLIKRREDKARFLSPYKEGLCSMTKDLRFLGSD